MALAIQGVGKRFGDRRVLDDVSFGLDRGVTALLGLNGAGKSTLMRILATVEDADEGVVTVEGSPVAGSAGRKAYRSELGWLPQHFSYPPAQTVRQYVEYVAWLKCVPRGSRAAAAREAVAAVGLEDRLDERLARLSGGMLRRAGLAQALVNEPAVLLLDEPSAGLDPEQRAALGTVIHRAGERAAVLVATHLLEDVASAADFVLVLHQGSILFDGSVEDFVEGDADDVTVENLAESLAVLTGAAEDAA